MTTYNPKGDSCLSIWADAYETGAIVFPPDARVLEIGCAEADWQTPMLALRPDLRITGIDWRACKRPGTTIKGDVLAFDFPEASLDAVVGISSIEHIGLGHYDADPLQPGGDARCMEQAHRWLAKGGWAYLDVPFNPSGYLVDGTSHRVYDWDAVDERLIPPGLVLERHWYATRQGHVVPKLEAHDLPHYDYVALLLRKV
jgi:SAM-dependent methyltransferase